MKGTRELKWWRHDQIQWDQRQWNQICGSDVDAAKIKREKRRSDQIRADRLGSAGRVIKSSAARLDQEGEGERCWEEDGLAGISRIWEVGQ